MVSYQMKNIMDLTYSRPGARMFNMLTGTRAILFGRHSRPAVVCVGVPIISIILRYAAG